MAIIETLKKLLGQKRQEHESISPDEMELMSYKKEEYRDNLRKELARYRLKKNREILVGNTFADQAREIHGKKGFLECENIFNKQKNMFNGRNTILGNDDYYKKKRRRY